MMKYFTLDGWIRDQDIQSYDPERTVRADNDYKRYLASIMLRLPDELKRLLAEYSLHDGRLRDLQIDIPAATVKLRFDAGDITMREGRDISLHYLGVTFMQSTADPEKGLLGPHGYGDVGNDEMELLESGLVEHRYLFSSGIQMLIRFRTFRLEEHGRS